MREKPVLPVNSGNAGGKKPAGHSPFFKVAVLVAAIGTFVAAGTANAQSADTSKPKASIRLVQPSLEIIRIREGFLELSGHIDMYGKKSGQTTLAIGEDNLKKLRSGGSLEIAGRNVRPNGEIEVLLKDNRFGIVLGEDKVFGIEVKGVFEVGAAAQK